LQIFTYPQLALKNVSFSKQETSFSTEVASLGADVFTEVLWQLPISGD
jgi:hypothetical protein